MSGRERLRGLDGLLAVVGRHRLVAERVEEQREAVGAVAEVVHDEDLWHGVSLAG